MTRFGAPVRDHMRAPVHTVRDGDRLAGAERRMTELGISGLAVINGRGIPVGVITRTDLLRAGRVRVVEGTRDRLLTVPDARVAEFRSPGVDIVDPGTPLATAARRMVDGHHHRLFVATERRLEGVIGRMELLHAVSEAHVEVPLSELVSGSLVVVDAGEPVTLAVDRMGAAHVRGLVVVEEGWPVGIFGQDQALAARDADPQRPVEEWMSPSFLCLPAGIPVHRAAQQALSARADRILAADGQEVRGLVTGTDFARLVGGRAAREAPRMG